MPEHLVHRINASLAAEQAQRGARMSSTSVTPLLPSGRRGRPRLLFGIAGAAAALAVVAALSSTMLINGQSSTTASTAGRGASTSRPAAARGSDSPSAADKAPAASGLAKAPALVQTALTGTRYTRADFLAQARELLRLPPREAAGAPADSGSFVATPSRLKDCLRAIGAGRAEALLADVAFYEGQPAVILVATTNGVPVAYVVGAGCSHADPALMRPATPLS